MTNDDDRISTRLIKADPFVQIELYHCRLCRQRSEAGESSPHETAAATEIEVEGISPAGGGRHAKFLISHPPTAVVTGHVYLEPLVLRPGKAEFERNSLTNVVDGRPLSCSDLQLRRSVFGECQKPRGQRDHDCQRDKCEGTHHHINRHRWAPVRQALSQINLCSII